MFENVCRIDTYTVSCEIHEREGLMNEAAVGLEFSTNSIRCGIRQRKVLTPLAVKFMSEKV